MNVYKYLCSKTVRFSRIYKSNLKKSSLHRYPQDTPCWIKCSYEIEIYADNYKVYLKKKKKTINFE